MKIDQAALRLDQVDDSPVATIQGEPGESNKRKLAAAGVPLMSSGITGLAPATT